MVLSVEGKLLGPVLAGLADEFRSFRRAEGLEEPAKVRLLLARSERTSFREGLSAGVPEHEWPAMVELPFRNGGQEPHEDVERVGDGRSLRDAYHSSSRVAPAARDRS